MASPAGRPQMMTAPEGHPRTQRSRRPRRHQTGPPPVPAAGAGDLIDHRKVWLKPRDALDLLDHLRPLIRRRGDEPLQPPRWYWVCVELAGNVRVLVVQRRHHLRIGARRIDDRTHIWLCRGGPGSGTQRHRQTGRCDNQFRPPQHGFTLARPRPDRLSSTPVVAEHLSAAVAVRDSNGHPAIPHRVPLGAPEMRRWTGTPPRRDAASPPTQAPPRWRCPSERAPASCAPASRTARSAASPRRW